jgi:Uma2 family endonuclease
MIDLRREPSVLADVDEDGVYYSSSDDEPMGETEWHVKQLAYLIEMLDLQFASTPEVLVSGNNLIYYERGRPKRYLVPDLYVTLGVPKLPRRRSYWPWREGKFPDFILELLSDRTRDRDYGTKAQTYAEVFGTPEYFLCDPDPESVEGFRLEGKSYHPIEPDPEGRVWSEQLGLGFSFGSDGWVQVYRRDGSRLLSPPELAAEAARAEELAAEVARLQEELRRLKGG